jgi:flagellar hook-length control protein FliK
MNVDGQNLLSMLSGGTDLESLQQALLNQDFGSADFSEALMQQVELLQQAVSEPESTGTSALQELREFFPQAENQQELAALKGTTLPPGRKIDDTIDLEATIDVLQDVMDHITEATAFIESVSSSVSNAIEHVMTQLDAELSNPSAEAVPVLVPNIEDFKELKADFITEDDAELPRFITQHENKPLMMDGKMDAKEQSKFHQQMAREVDESRIDTEILMKKPPLQVVLPESDDDIALTELLNKEEAMQTADIDTSRVDTKIAEKISEQLDLSHTETIVNKAVPKIAADLIQLNRQMEVPAKADIPAMAKPLAHPEWQQEFGERILWMQTKSVQVAELRLNPQHLGPISIRVDVKQDQATLVFTAQHGVVRDAIEAAMPRLRDMLQGQQISLVDVNVSQQDTAEQRNSQGFMQHGNGDQQAPLAQNTNASDSDAVEQSVASITEQIEHSREITNRGLLNIFA